MTLSPPLDVEALALPSGGGAVVALRGGKLVDKNLGAPATLRDIKGGSGAGIPIRLSVDDKRVRARAPEWTLSLPPPATIALVWHERAERLLFADRITRPNRAVSTLKVLEPTAAP